MKVYFEFLVEQSSVDVLSVRIAVSMTVLMIKEITLIREAFKKTQKNLSNVKIALTPLTLI